MSATIHRAATANATTAPPPEKRHPYLQWSPDLQALNLLGDKWTLPIIRALAAGPRRFVDLQRGLQSISTEQLRSRLNRMVADGLLTRQRYREVPPRVDYELTDRARAAFPMIAAAARWALTYTWRSPRDGELVDVVEFFNLVPMLVTGAGRRGVVALVVVDGEEQRRTVTVTVPRGAGAMAELARELPVGDVDSTIVGSIDQWVTALSPDAERIVTGLRVHGDEQLAQHVVSKLTGH